MALQARKRYTFADALAWKENERVEIINGEVFPMITPLRVHQEICGEIFYQLANFLEGKKREVYMRIAVRLFEKDDDNPKDVDTMVEPDITVVCDKNKLDKYGCKGAPDMVIEILSPSTRRHDLITKYNLYKRAGVREYWIVNPGDQTVLVYTLENGILVPSEVYGAEEMAKVNVLDGCFIELSKVFSE